MLHLRITNLDSGEYREVCCEPAAGPPDECAIGSSKDCDLVLCGADVSQLHAKLIFQPETCCIMDANSRSGSYLNDQKLQPNEYYPLQSSDAISIGNFFILVQSLGGN